MVAFYNANVGWKLSKDPSFDWKNYWYRNPGIKWGWFWLLTLVLSFLAVKAERGLWWIHNPLIIINRASCILLPGDHACWWWIQRKNFTPHTQWKVRRCNCPESTQSKVLNSFGFKFLSVNPRSSRNAKFREGKGLENRLIRSSKRASMKWHLHCF